MGCLSVCLVSSASVQRLFCGIYLAFKWSFNEFVWKKVVSLSHSSTILGLTLQDDSLWTELTVQLLSCIRLFVTPWTAACQACLDITNSWNLFKFISIQSVMPSPSHPLLFHSPALNLSQHQGLFPTGKFFTRWATVYMLNWFSSVQVFVNSWTVAWQAPLAMAFSMWENWNGLPCHSPGCLPNPGINLCLSCFLLWIQVFFFFCLFVCLFVF